MKIHDVIACLKSISRALISTDHPILAQLIVTRKCNLSCSYCNEYNKVSAPIPLEVLKKRIEALARLKTSAITCTGGEPLLHPEIDKVIQSIRYHGILATLITNGYMLTETKIKKLNDAGLHELQISIDNIMPDEVSVKSLKVLDRKLQLLANYADFPVNINSVLGVSEQRTRDATVVAKKAVQYGFSHSVGLMHNEGGILKPLSKNQHDVYKEIGRITQSGVYYLNKAIFQKKLIAGKSNKWKCRAGARYLYICEYGLVHWCAQQRGYPGIPIDEYTAEDIRREYNTQKNCSPFCTVSCVQQVSFLDKLRSRQILPDPHIVNLNLTPT